MESVFLITLTILTLAYLIYGAYRDYKTHKLMEAPLFILSFGWVFAGYYLLGYKWDYLFFIGGYILITYLVFNLILKPWERFNTDIVVLFIAISSFISTGNFYFIPVIVLISLLISFIIAFLIDRGRYRFIPSKRIALVPGAVIPVGIMSLKALFGTL